VPTGRDLFVVSSTKLEPMAIVSMRLRVCALSTNKETIKEKKEAPYSERILHPNAPHK